MTKSAKEVTQEIQAIMRQITASVTFLPLLNEPCCFDLLVYADKDATVPVSWEDSDPCFIANAEQVRLRSFNTTVRIFNFNFHYFYCIIYPNIFLYFIFLLKKKKVHKVDLAVSYRVDEDAI